MAQRRNRLFDLIEAATSALDAQPQSVEAAQRSDPDLPPALAHRFVLRSQAAGFRSRLRVEFGRDSEVVRAYEHAYDEVDAAATATMTMFDEALEDGRVKDAILERVQLAESATERWMRLARDEAEKIVRREEKASKSTTVRIARRTRI